MQSVLLEAFIMSAIRRGISRPKNVASEDCFLELSEKELSVQECSVEKYFNEKLFYTLNIFGLELRLFELDPLTWTPAQVPAQK
jgi:hypothetical protein